MAAVFGGLASERCRCEPRKASAWEGVAECGSWVASKWFGAGRGFTLQVAVEHKRAAACRGECKRTIRPNPLRTTTRQKKDNHSPRQRQHLASVATSDSFKLPSN